MCISLGCKYHMCIKNTTNHHQTVPQICQRIFPPKVKKNVVNQIPYFHVVLIFPQFMFILLIYKGPLTPRLHKHSSIFSYIYFSHLIINPSRICVFMRKNFSQKGKPTVLVFLCQYQTSYDVFIINYQYPVFGYLGEIFEKPTL